MKEELFPSALCPLPSAFFQVRVVMKEVPPSLGAFFDFPFCPLPPA